MLQVRVGDGSEAVAELASTVSADSNRCVDVLVVDAGSGDASLAMSCPPAAFVEPAFLHHASTALSVHGVLVVNCVSRLDGPYRAAVEALQVRTPADPGGRLAQSNSALPNMQ